MMRILILVLACIAMPAAYAQDDFATAHEYFLDGRYDEAINIYDQMLAASPGNTTIQLYNGLAQSNAGKHAESLQIFFDILQEHPDNVLALTGMGLGFGNLGEYHEALGYFEEALKHSPNNTIITNYKDFAQKTLAKYPYEPTVKPKNQQAIKQVPDWIKNTAGWWSDSVITDADYLAALGYLVGGGTIHIPQKSIHDNEPGQELPVWLKESTRSWSRGAAPDLDFVRNVQWLVENSFIDAYTNTTKSHEQLEHELYLFSRYLQVIQNKIASDTRYIEFSNPSKDVIKKFLRDYIKWNFEQEAKRAAEKFPNPRYQIVDDEYVIYYTVYVNEQPSGLPLDHISTLKDSFAFWESRQLDLYEKKAKIKFVLAEEKYKANVWVTWVVRDLGQGVLGHAHLGKGIVEVTLGDYDCDGSFQLYDVGSVQTIMTHELGHSIGLRHVNEKSHIMYPAYAPSYAYCLLGGTS